MSPTSKAKPPRFLFPRLSLHKYQPNLPGWFRNSSKSTDLSQPDDTPFLDFKSPHHEQLRRSQR